MRLDRRKRTAARPLQPANGGIGVKHRNAGTPECPGRGGFAHANAAGEADHPHAS
jgi:hypothetical protein